MRKSFNVFTVKYKSARSEREVQLVCIDLLDWCIFSHIKT